MVEALARTALIHGRIDDFPCCVGRRTGVCTIISACKTKGQSSDLAEDYIRLGPVGGLHQGMEKVIW